MAVHFFCMRGGKLDQPFSCILMSQGQRVLVLFLVPIGVMGLGLSPGNHSILPHFNFIQLSLVFCGVVECKTNR